MATGVDETKKFPQFGFNGIFVTPDEAFAPKTVAAAANVRPQDVVFQPVIPITQSDPVDLQKLLARRTMR